MDPAGPNIFNDALIEVNATIDHFTHMRTVFGNLLSGHFGNLIALEIDSAIVSQDIINVILEKAETMNVHATGLYRPRIEALHGRTANYSQAVVTTHYVEDTMPQIDVPAIANADVIFQEYQNSRAFTEEAYRAVGALEQIFFRMNNNRNHALDELFLIAQYADNHQLNNFHLNFIVTNHVHVNVTLA